MNKLFKISLIIFTCLAGTSKVNAEDRALSEQNKSLYMQLIYTSFIIINEHLKPNSDALKQFKGDFAKKVHEPMHEFCKAWRTYKTDYHLGRVPPGDLEWIKLGASLKKIARDERALSMKIEREHPGELATALSQFRSAIEYALLVQTQNILSKKRQS